MIDTLRPAVVVVGAGRRADRGRRAGRPGRRRGAGAGRPERTAGASRGTATISATCCATVAVSQWTGYARALVGRAVAAGATVRTEANVPPSGRPATRAGDHPAGTVRRAGPRCCCHRRPGAGAPPGASPATARAASYTTGQLQNQVHLQARPGRRAAVWWSAECVTGRPCSPCARPAAARCDDHTQTGCRVHAALTLAVGGSAGAGGDEHPGCAGARPRGLSGVEVEDTRTGSRWVVAVRAVVFTGTGPRPRAVRLVASRWTRHPSAPGGHRTADRTGPACSPLARGAHPWTPTTSPRMDGRHVAAQISPT